MSHLRAVRILRNWTCLVTGRFGNNKQKLGEERAAFLVFRKQVFLTLCVCGWANGIIMLTFDIRCSGFIPSFQSCPKLKYLDLSDNEFSGPIPTLAARSKQKSAGETSPAIKASEVIMFHLPKTLEQLYLNGNDLTGPVPDFARFEYTCLRTLSVESNFLAGIIPSLLGCKGLAVLNLQVNRFSGAPKWKATSSNYPAGCVVSV